MDFDNWLSERLQQLKTDEAVFAPYIKSIVEGDEDLEQKIEDLDGILCGLGGDSNLDVEGFRKEIISRWEAHVASNSTKGLTSLSSSNSSTTNAISGASISGNSAENPPGDSSGSATTLDSQLEKLLRLSPEELCGSSSDHKTNNNNTLNSPTDSTVRAAILQHYAQESGSEEDDEGETLGSGMGGLSKNMNAERVLSAQREFKEKQKADAAKKREKDREDRAKQKKLAEEKKEKAKKKTAKVERKR